MFTNLDKPTLAGLLHEAIASIVATKESTTGIYTVISLCETYIPDDEDDPAGADAAPADTKKFFTEFIMIPKEIHGTRFHVKYVPTIYPIFIADEKIGDDLLFASIFAHDVSGSASTPTGLSLTGRTPRTALEDRDECPILSPVDGPRARPMAEAAYKEKIRRAISRTPKFEILDCEDTGKTIIRYYYAQDEFTGHYKSLVRAAKASGVDITVTDEEIENSIKSFRGGYPVGRIFSWDYLIDLFKRHNERIKVASPKRKKPPKR